MVKKIILISLVCLLSIAYGQTDSTQAVFTQRSEWLGWEINATELNGRDIDGTRFFLLGGDTCRKIFPGIWQMKVGGIFGNGTSMKIMIDSFLSRPYVKELNFTADSATKVLIGSGGSKVTVPVGKIISVHPMVTFSGATNDTFNFAGNQLIANQFQRVFDTNIVAQNIQGANGRLYGAWWGMDSTATWNDKAYSKGVAAMMPGETFVIPPGPCNMQFTFNFTTNVTGSYRSSFKYNTGATAVNYVFSQTAASNITISNLKIDGSNRANWICKLTTLNTFVKFINVEFCFAQQQTGATVFAAGLRVDGNADYFLVDNCYIHDIQAPVNGTARGFIASYGAGNRAARYGEIKATSFRDIGPISDGDQIVVQDFTDSSYMYIHDCFHYAITKRGQKLQAPGIISKNNTFYSDYWTTNATRSYSAASVYDRAIIFDGNIAWGGVYEKTVDIGSNSAGQSVSDVYVTNNKFYTSYSASLIGNADGIRMLGQANFNVHVEKNYTQYNRFNYFSDCGGTNLYWIGNTGKYAGQNGFSAIGTSNSFPYNWITNLTVSGNEVDSATASTSFDIWRVRNLTFTNNTSMGSTKTLNTITLRMDSCLGQTTVDGNQNLTAAAKASPNWGSTTDRPAVTSSAAWLNAWYYNTTTSIKEYWNGTMWVPSFSYSINYTPTATSIANVFSSAITLFKATRVGNNVHVSGQILVTPTAGAATVTTLDINLAIASTISNSYDINGIIAGGVTLASGVTGTVSAGPSGNLARITFTANSTSQHTFKVQFDYPVQ